MVLIQVLDKTCQCRVGVLYVHLAFALEVFFIQIIKDFLLEDVLCVHYLAKLVHLIRILLDPPLGIPMQLHYVAMDPLVENGSGVKIRAW